MDFIYIRQRRLGRRVYQGFALALVLLLFLTVSPLTVLNAQGTEVVETPASSEDTESPAASPDDPAQDAAVETGDASAQGSLENEVNTNEIAPTGGDETGNDEIPNTETETTEPADPVSTSTPQEQEPAEAPPSDAASSTPEVQSASSSPETIPDTATSTDAAQTTSATSTASSTAQNVGDATASSTATSTVGVENSAAVDNQANIEALTGSSTATTTQGTSTVETGNAISSANIINVINTNIFNSFGLLILLNALFGSDTFDVRDLNIDWFGGSASTTQATCSLQSCSDGNVAHTITSSSTAAIYNDIVVRSYTGGNVAYGPDGAIISTGDAYAGANVVNVANSNFVDSNYLLISLNNFGDFSGDIVLPGRSFFEEFFSRLGAGIASFFGAENSADIDNNVAVHAGTGDNTASSTAGSAAVATGDATSGATVVNSANTNLIGGGDSVFILLRVHGEWSGDIFGLPPGLSWAETPLGIQIYNTGEGGGGTAGATAFSGSNSASMFNNINVVALTGENRVDAETGEALIQTGDAQAGASVINVANTNVVGRNWILAVFNIFGNWSGNLSFGRPDLWVGAQAQLPEGNLSPGSQLEYRFTITNNGDSDMTDTVLTVAYDSPYLQFESGGAEGGLSASWDLGTVGVGETIERVYAAHIADNLPNGQTPITLTATVEGRETDANEDDNTEEIGIVALRQGSYGAGNDRPDSPGRAYLFVEKEAITEEAVVMASSSVEYVITIRNNGRSPAYEAVLHDTLTDMSGKVVNEQSWNLGTILPKEEITVAYSVLYSASTTSGIYTNTAYVSATDDRSRDEGEGDANSDTATSMVLIAGVLTSTACEPYLTAYLSIGGDNRPEEVKKLQEFLLERTDAPSLEVSGVFDEATEVAVRSFQTLYRADVLEPWGITDATGNVYFTTQKKINELACGGETEFELTARQQSEIDQFRSRVEAMQEEGEEIVIPANEDVGLTDGERVIGMRDVGSAPPVTEAAPAKAQLAAAAGAPISTSTMIAQWFSKVRGFFSNVPRVQASDLVPW